MGFEKKNHGWRFEFYGPNYFDYSSMSCPNTDLIAVSLACLKDPKNLQ